MCFKNKIFWRRIIKMKTTNENTQYNHNLKPTRLAFLAALMLITFVAASAQEDAPGKAPSARTVSASAAPDAPPVAAVSHSVKGIYLSSGTDNGASFPGNYTLTAVDSPQSVVCPGTSGTCTIQADHWVEMQGSTLSNEAAVCLAVDGVFDNNCGFFEDKIPPDSSWLQVTSSHAMSGVRPGTHTLQTFAESTYGMNVAYFNINYRVYKP
jgi:hypothetical protein